MVKIFAKKGTAEKVLVLCKREKVGAILTFLNANYGENWIWVDSINPGEILRFNDGLTYLGFHGREERYCNGIEKLK